MTFRAVRHFFSPLAAKVLYLFFFPPKTAANPGRVDSLAGADVITELKVIRMTLQAMNAKMTGGSQEPPEIQTKDDEIPF